MNFEQFFTISLFGLLLTIILIMINHLLFHKKEGVFRKYTKK
ncbi:hypothetical protein IC1_06721 [Bacillus cereus VD022]|uniref:Uncharacterized protein n=1 Tax=Bacillus cereus TIAC219 TaxID=718222 RepID=A0ABC9SP75_BACCE|nr:hypothetical protein IC1_06721 [Bacillus cereus VD022]EOQ55277.1 hypothetical protein IAY_06775 [Bacillus cereus TIAC219]